VPQAAIKKKSPKRPRDPRNLLTSLILVFPLFIVYQLGVLVTWPTLNGADLLTRFLLVNLGLSRQAYLGYTLAAAALYVLSMGVLRKRQEVQLRMAIPVLLEAGIYALTLGSVIVLVMTRVFHLDPRLVISSALGPGAPTANVLAKGAASSALPGLAAGLAEQGLLARFVMSCGAGVWEEAVFRLLILGGLVALGHNVMGLRRPLAIAGGLFLSAALFSAAHHIPPNGDPFRIGVFVYRLLAGVAFGLIYWWRGFAVAVYSHAFYDLYVLLLHP